STDSTAQVVSEFQKKDPRVIYLKKINEGLPHALNFGLKIAKGAYLTWSSDDNLYAKDAIESMLSFLIDQNSSFVYCDFYRFRKTPLKRRQLVKLPDFNAAMPYNYFGPCFLYTREVAKVIGDYDPETKYAEDFDYWIRVSKKFPISHLKKPLYFYLEHEDSLSERKTLEIMLVTILVRLKNNVLEINTATQLCIQLKSRQNWRLGQKFSKLTYLPLKIFSVFYYWWNKINFSRTYYEILRDFKTKKQNFQNTKNKLLNLLRVK
ncbi:MAG: glycosyltransferase family 2 protein, partial [Candidatus Helarchaeota archaeon]